MRTLAQPASAYVSETAPLDDFERLLLAECRRAQRRWWLRHVLGQLRWTLLLSGVIAAGLWLQGQALPARWFALLPLFAALTYTLLRTRPRPTSAWVVAFDQQLASTELISAAWAALSTARRGAASPFALHLAQTAQALLHAAQDRHLPRWSWRQLAALGPGLLICAFALTWPTRPALVPELPIDARTLQWQQLDELAAALELGELSQLNEPERARLRELSVQLQAVQKRLRQGASAAAVRADLDRLHDTLTAAQQVLDVPHERSGLQAALALLREDPATARAARALERGDALGMDAELKRLSTAEERAARQRAQQLLQAAEQAARAQQANGTARLLSEQNALLSQRAQAAERIRELITQLGDERDTPNQPQPPAALQLELKERPAKQSQAPQMQMAARQRLAQRLQAGLDSGQFDFTPQGSPVLEAAEAALGKASAQQLTRALQNFAEPPAAAQHFQSMWETSRALARMQQALRGPATPLSEPHTGRHAYTVPPAEESAGAPSPGVGGRSATRTQATPAAEALSLVAKTQQALDPAQGVYRDSQGQSWSVMPVGSNPALPPVLPALGPEQLQGVARPTFPTEYREQISRYFAAE